MDQPRGEIPLDVMARFTAAEARLYPMVMMDPVGYQLATALVGLVANELRRNCMDITTVLERRRELIGRLPELAADAGLTMGALPADAVVDAASALRCRELVCADKVRPGAAALDIAAPSTLTKSYESCREVNRPGECK